MPDRSCSVGDCSRPTRSARAELCNTHYFRVRRTGSTGPAEIWDRQRKPCAMDDCDEQAAGYGYCNRHYLRVRSHGDPTYVTPRTGETASRWRGDAVGYHGAHDRVRDNRGSASRFACIGCGQAALHWAYDHADPDELLDPEGPYSAKVEHYQPMCVPCHKRFDLARIATQRSAG